ncbi:MAG: multicopper oxidase domain-containing protein, partial [Chloroflexota bacterium]
HPHSHGATQNQVASGMAGFIIISGDVDDLINERIAGDAAVAWDHKSGDWDYRERSVFLQRVMRGPTANISGNSTGPDPDAKNKKKKGANKPLPIVNGSTEPGIITMRPGAIERWRVLNGSVDGNGYMRLALLEGEFADDSSNALQKVEYSGGARSEFPVAATDYAPISFEKDGATVLVQKAPLWQLSWDGVTRVVTNDDGSSSYQLRDLSTVNDGVEPDFASFTDCYKPGNLDLCYNRPNELYMVDGNRADVMFQAPALGAAEQAIYTLVALPAVVGGMRESTTKVLAYIVVSGDPVPGAADYAFDALLDGLTVSPYELPIGDKELEITTPAERAARDIGDGTAYRTRVVRYAGWGAAALPVAIANADYVAANPDKEKLSYYTPPPSDSTKYTLPVSSDDQTGVAVTNVRRFPSGDLPAIILPPVTRTMNIDGQKFFPTDEEPPRMLLDTAEEWAVYNHSLETYSVPLPDSSWTPEQVQEYVTNNPELLYYQFDYVDEAPDGAPASPQPYFGIHRTSYPMTRGQVNAVNAKRSTDGDPWTLRAQMTISTSAVDHPFHIHQNPVWLMRMDVPDENGDMVNVLSEPRWADVVDLPRNGGRVVFRSRFMDYQGEFVDHCHILLHEDNGMMQRLLIIGDAAVSNYMPSDTVASADASDADVDTLYGKPSPADSWKRSMSFVDGNATGQVFPGEGFDPTPPEPPTE